jgi:hypothetical protein
VIRRLLTATLLIASAAAAQSRNHAAPPLPARIYEFRIPGDDLSVSSITTGTDGAIWFTAYSSAGESDVGRMALDGHVTIVATVAGHAANITTGPDGALWLTVDGKIARTTPAGITGRFNVGAGEITAGADGALWFIGSDAAGIGRLTLAGELSEIPSPIEQPTQIAATDDGAIWVENDLRIGRIASDRSTSTFSPFDALHRLQGWVTFGPIVPGPDGRSLLFTMSRERSFGVGEPLAPGSVISLSPEGVFTQLASWQDASPHYIVRGKDAYYLATWLCAPPAATCGANVLRMNSAGDVVPLAYLPWHNPGRVVTGITQGGDGNVWVSYFDYGDSPPFPSTSGIARVVSH